MCCSTRRNSGDSRGRLGRYTRVQISTPAPRPAGESGANRERVPGVQRGEESATRTCQGRSCRGGGAEGFAGLLSAGGSAGIFLTGGNDHLLAFNSLTILEYGLVFESETYGKYRDNLTSGVNNPYSGGFDAGNNQ